MKADNPLVLRLLFIGLTLLCLAACSENASRSSPNLVIWHLEPTPAFVQALETVASQLEAQNPGLRVQLVNKPWNTVSSELAQAITQGEGPDLAMVEPYMMSSLVQKGLLEPLDDVYDSIGREDFYPFLREINEFDGSLYGIPHAYGVGYFSIRSDILRKDNLPPPSNWSALLELAEHCKKDFRYPVQLCGGTNFLLDQLFVSLLASNGGSLFSSESNRPQLNSPQVIDTLAFLDKLASYAPPDWKTKAYQDTFVTYANSGTAIVPLTAARTVNQIRIDAPPEKANDSVFGAYPTPVGPSGHQSITFIDAEPWVMFSASQTKQYAKQFLRQFFSNEHYISFCMSVPLHLSPARRSLSDQYFADDVFRNWKSWVRLQTQLIEQKRVLPLLSSSKTDHHLPFLWEFNQSRILTDMISDTNTSPADRASIAQQRAEQLLDRLGHRNWK